MRKALVIGLAVSAIGSSVVAQSALESRLGALLGQERQALAMVPDARLAALTTVPPAAERDIAVSPQAISYSNAFLANMPAAQGNAQWRCLSEALYFEARGETTEGLFAVGEVILNRVDSNKLPPIRCVP